MVSNMESIDNRKISYSSNMPLNDLKRQVMGEKSPEPFKKMFEKSKLQRFGFFRSPFYEG